MDHIGAVALAVALVAAAFGTSIEAGAEGSRIRVSTQNPYYWEYKGEPILLLGGSVEDNLFQIPNLEVHLDLLQACRGNYVRNTMSSRDEGNLWPFAKTGERYDLDQWNEAYWERFERFLAMTAERDVIVQIEVWATFDFYRDIWARNPFNPGCNVQYTPEESGLPLEVNSHPTRCENPFFFTVPAAQDNPLVLRYQQRFVDKLLEHALPFGHVLYCMDNETSVTPAWGAYWAQYIRAKATEAGLSVETTEMWDAWDLAHPMHRATFDHPETYTFVDVSQNNHNSGQKHWDNFQGQRERIREAPRPLNNVKIYGADGGRFGTTRDGIERFWRNILGGAASARFHRPDSGIGLSEAGQANIKSARMLTERIDIASAMPRNDLLGRREPNEAYCMAQPGATYLVYFPDGGEVTLDLRTLDGPLLTSWLDIAHARWAHELPIEGGAIVPVTCPGKGHWAVAIRHRQPSEAISPASVVTSGRDCFASLARK
ncbi:MAG TPA: hypothetical protein ENN80_08785 [Candidatus Hydrogenedentes bacterium]|nr:hypothetical protein [Candidatus Hydrogenedentota bacterium]